MADFEVYLDLRGHTRPIGLARSNRVRGVKTEAGKLTRQIGGRSCIIRLRSFH